MTATFAERRAAELAVRLASVQREFEYWEVQSRSGAPLEKHHTQIRRVTTALRAFAGRVGEEPATPAGRQDAALLALDLHEIWDFFRSKLALRCVPWFQPTLIAADDYAWACYQPATEAAVRHGMDRVDVREPPLVILSGGAVARAHARGDSYEGLVEVNLFGPTLVPALKELPLPVVAVPWYQVDHVPDVLAIGHEVGHLVEQDLRLTPTMRTLLARELGGTAPARLQSWERWQGEVFADVYGCLAAGPAYAAWLLDLLAEAVPAGREGAPPTPGPYPPAGVRASLVLACVGRLGFGFHAAELGAAWSELRPGDQPTAFHADVEPVVGAILDGPYPAFGGGLRSALSFGPLEQQAADDEARRLQRGHDLTQGDVRVLFAAGTLAFRSDPQAFRAGRLDSRVLDRAVQLRQRGVRRRRDAAKPIPASVQAADRLAGQRLFDRLTPRQTPTS